MTNLATRGRRFPTLYRDREQLTYAARPHQLALRLVQFVPSLARLPPHALERLAELAYRSNPSL